MRSLPAPWRRYHSLSAAGIHVLQVDNSRIWILCLIGPGRDGKEHFYPPAWEILNVLRSSPDWWGLFLMVCSRGCYLLGKYQVGTMRLIREMFIFWSDSWGVCLTCICAWVFWGLLRWKYVYGEVFFFFHSVEPRILGFNRCWCTKYFCGRGISECRLKILRLESDWVLCQCQDLKKR